jgi:hypothetical protein
MEGATPMKSQAIVFLRILCPGAFLAAILTGAYIAREEVIKGVQPEHYEFIIGLLIHTCGIVIEIVFVILFIDYFAESAQRRLSEKGKDHLINNYDRRMHPFLGSLAEFFWNFERGGRTLRPSAPMTLLNIYCSFRRR